MLYSSSFSEESTLRNKGGEAYRLRTGESAFSLYEEDRVRTAEQLSDNFPFLVLPALRRIDPNRIEVTKLPNGTTVYSAKLVIGNLGLTARGYEHPGTNNDSIVKYTFDSDNRLTAIDREGSPTWTIEYGEAEHSDLAPSLQRNRYQPNAMQLVQVETYIPGRPDLFEPQAVLSRIQKLTQQNAEEEQALVAKSITTTKGQEQLRESHQPDNGVFGWRSNRMALILTGLVIIGIGGFAWWKNR